MLAIRLPRAARMVDAPRDLVSESISAPPAPVAKSHWVWVWRAIAVATVAVVAVFLWWAWDHGAIVTRLRRASPWAFFTAMAVLPAFGAPVTPFFIVAGASFGARTGLVGSLIAITVNVAGCYWIARSALRRFLEPLLRRFRYRLPDFAAREKGAASFTVAVKLAPGLPTFLKNYLLGIAGVPFLLYLALSILITGTYAVSFVLLGQSVLKHDFTKAIAPAVILPLLGFGLWWFRRRRRRVATAR
jgi:uncharacterized membrane protein YdjX (TVP38/TMEM64 family)